METLNTIKIRCVFVYFFSFFCFIFFIFNFCFIYFFFFSDVHTKHNIDSLYSDFFHHFRVFIDCHCSIILFSYVLLLYDRIWVLMQFFYEYSIQKKVDLVFIYQTMPMNFSWHSIMTITNPQDYCINLTITTQLSLGL